MSDTARVHRQFGEGPLARVAATVYLLLVVELLLVLTTAPGLVVLVLLDRDASNLPLVAACALPVGPALSAALFALRHWRPDLTDPRPAAQFWRGYRLNLAAVLRIWVPLLILLTIVAVNLAHRDIAGVPPWWSGLLVLLGAVALLWGANALVISSLFEFRAADVARLAAYYLIRRPGVTLGNAGVIVAAVALTALASEAVLLLLGSVLSVVLLAACRPMTTEIRDRFTA
jgi:uncharacterized membrane protein YesL